MSKIEVKRLGESPVEDFFKFHDNPKGCGWCYCVAWWVPTWDGFPDRTAEENRRFRKELFARGEFDGYLLYIDDEPRGWCQVGQRDRLPRLKDSYKLTETEPEVWAITCFLIDPEIRRAGYARRMLGYVIDDLRGQGVGSVEAFPKGELADDPDDLWNGPLTVYQEAGFKLVGEFGHTVQMRLELNK